MQLAGLRRRFLTDRRCARSRSRCRDRGKQQTLDLPWCRACKARPVTLFGPIDGQNNCKQVQACCASIGSASERGQRRETRMRNFARTAASWWLVVILTLACGQQASRAAEARFALVIGNDEYKA